MTDVAESIEALLGLLVSGLILIFFGHALSDFLDINLVLIGYLFIIVTVLLGIALIVTGVARLAEEL